MITDSTLTSLDLNSIHFISHNALVVFQQALMSCVSLQKLFLQNSPYFRKFAHLTLIKVPVSIHLTELSLRQIALMKTDLSNLNKALSLNSQLQRLTIFGCSIKTPGLVDSISCSLQYLKLDISIAHFDVYKLFGRAVQEGRLELGRLELNNAMGWTDGMSYKQVTQYVASIFYKSSSIGAFAFRNGSLKNLRFGKDKIDFLRKIEEDRLK